MLYKAAYLQTWVSADLMGGSAGEYIIGAFLELLKLVQLLVEEKHQRLDPFPVLKELTSLTCYLSAQSYNFCCYFSCVCYKGSTKYT